MHQLINAIIKFRNALVFSLLFVFSILLTSQSSGYHRDLFSKWSTSLSSWLHQSTGSVGYYMNLSSDNQRLTEENELLLQELLLQKQAGDTPPIPYKVGAARVLRNSFLLDHNYLTLNVGETQGVRPEMGVVSAQGIVGVVRHTTSKYAQVMSILNKDLQVNAKLKKTNHFGSLKWEGGSPTILKLNDVPISASIALGDTITTGGMSTIFPDGIPIGTVGGFSQKPLTNFYDIDVTLFQDMTDLGVVYVIENPDRVEMESFKNAHDE